MYVKLVIMGVIPEKEFYFPVETQSMTIIFVLGGLQLETINIKHVLFSGA